MLTRHARQFAIVLAALFGFVSAARAGGGPENVLLVVNTRSWASISVANHFIRLRQLAPANVLYLDYAGPIDQVSADQFLTLILRPAMRAIDERRLAGQIDYLVYSSDFPWAVDFSGPLAGANLPIQWRPVGSLTGLSYFAPTLSAGDIDFLSPAANQYCPPVKQFDEVPDTRAFRSWYGWGRDGARLEAGGRRYLLSTMLAVTSGRGLSVTEAIDSLRQSAAADGSHPRGTVYFTLDGDVRTRTRQPTMAAAAGALAKLALRAEVVSTPLPRGKPDVVGLTMGAADFNWQESGSKFLPGAIGDNLTSCGGMFRYGDAQTPLTNLLRGGAAGASGTVVEPYALQAKFPLPFVHVHYARGCSLAEAFYQSVASPYQLLVVGDPLCQPWADRAQLALQEPLAAEWRGGVRLTPAIVAQGRAPIDRFEWYLDGQHLATSAGFETVTVNTAAMSDGYHELRLAASELSPLETQAQIVIPGWFNNRGQSVTLRRTDVGTVRWGESLRLALASPGAAQIVLVHQSRPIARVAGEAGELNLDPLVFGMGPVRLQAVAIGHLAPDVQIVSKPLDLYVEPMPPIHGQGIDADEPLLPGFVLETSDGRKQIIHQVANEHWLREAGAKPGETYTIVGLIETPAADVHQFQLRHGGRLAISVDGQTVYDAESEPDALRMAPVNLARGRHQVRLVGKAGAPARLELAFGAAGIRPLNGLWLRHFASAEPPKPATVPQAETKTK
ncbi:MAG: hypothetical protein JSS27_12135 [Planctomycetes bacterium]|nr:hypothetical protein [Planctomycetota bacterium]